MAMRVGGDNKYKFGFNGQEMSNEIKGEGNSYTAEFWEYDPRIGRRWNLDPRPVMGYSPYSAYTNNPIVFSDPYGDNSVVGATGTHKVEIDEKTNKLGFYEAGKDYFLSGTKTKVPIKAGQLRSFTNELGTFSARWTQITDNFIGFEGYKNDDGLTYEQAFNKFWSSWDTKLALWLKNFGEAGLRSYEADPVAHNLKVSTSLLMMGSSSIVMEAMPLSFSTKATTKLDDMSALGTLTFAPKRADLAFGLLDDLHSFSATTGFANYRQFSTGAFNKAEIQAAIMNPNNNLHFNLEGFKNWKYLKYAQNPVGPSPVLGNVTNWEMYLIKNTPGVIDRTTFYKKINGAYQIAPKPR
ncbi:hypothetical protein FSB84_22960 [Pseudobacter ginsenosidimutans]|nr:hypothetical protein FSB84_22960 [Pseudobacter ginsenosidimutans]